jgi:hypothetical protein
VTTLKLGWTNPLTDAFGAHPLLGPVLDLNDGAVFCLTTPEGLALSAPRKSVTLTGNPRTQGERAVRALYQHNREATISLILGPGASYAALIASVRSLVAWLDAPPASPIAVQWQPPNAQAPVYLDVVAAAHTIPADEGDWLRLQLEPIEIVLVVRPGLRGDRVWLQNLVVNPGFEAPSGPGVLVFSDSFANTNAYSVQAGAAPAVAGNVMTIPNGGRVAFGSPAWGAINAWYVRFQYVSGAVPDFYLHFTDVNNFLDCYVGSTTLTLRQVVGGTVHTLGTSNAYTALTNLGWYWLLLTQFPSVPGNAPDVQAVLYSDNAGAVGSQITFLGPVPTYDGVTALVGQPQIGVSGNSLPIGGAYGGVHTVALFGPGGWQFDGNNGSGSCSGAWDGASGPEGRSGSGAANTYAGGPATSFGAARIDLPPAGTVNTFWTHYNGGSPAGSWAIPLQAGGDVLAASAWVRSSGLSGTATIALQVYEYDASGTFLRQTTLQQVTGNQASWTHLAGTVTTSGGTSFVSVFVNVVETTAGGSANGTVWLDNVLAYDQTATGMTSMPYCELRFPQSPAQLLVSGLMGDMPAPAFLALGTYLASWAPGNFLVYALGRRGAANANARLVAPSVGAYATGSSPQSVAVLDSSSYGGYYISASVGGGGWNPRGFSPTGADEPGMYHLLARMLTTQAAGNLGNVEVRVVTQQRSLAWYGNSTGSDIVGSYYGPYVYPFSASSTWTVCDAGQAVLPPWPAGALTDPSQLYLTPRPNTADLTSGGSTLRCGWQLLLPIDGSLLVGVINNPSNGPLTVTAQWLWSYFDGLLMQRGGPNDVPSQSYSVEAAPLLNAAHSGGGAGTTGSGAINVNSGADPMLLVDPTLGGGVNQLAGYITDSTADVLPLVAEIAYTPLYLYPR